MPRKAPRPDHQVQLLAAELGRRWVAADGIEPWLRRNLARLARLVRDEGWSWADVGRAMTEAGILYGTGNPWSGPLLQAKVGQVRMQLRRREGERVPSTPREAAPPLPAVQAVAAPRPALAAGPLGGEPEFRFVRLREPPTAAALAAFDPREGEGEYVEPSRRTFHLAQPHGLGPPQEGPVPAPPTAPGPAPDPAPAAAPAPATPPRPAPVVNVRAVLARFRGEPYPKG